MPFPVTTHLAECFKLLIPKALPLDPEGFAAFFAKFTTDFQSRRDTQSNIDAIAVDGKMIRRSFDHASETSALNRLTAWGHGERLSLGCAPMALVLPLAFQSQEP